MNEYEALAREFMQEDVPGSVYITKLSALIEKSDRRAERVEALRREHLQLWTAENYNIGPCPKCESRKISLNMVETVVKNHGVLEPFFRPKRNARTVGTRSIR